MSAIPCPVLVRPVRSRFDFERRTAERQDCQLDATAHSVDSQQDALAWGATVRDVSRTGVGLTVCFPFRAGTFLAVELFGRSLLTRVAHVRDRGDGTWHAGCEFVKPLTDEEFQQVI